MKNLFTLLLALSLASCTVSSTKEISDFPPSEPGKCYAKCMSMTRIEKVRLDPIPIYRGGIDHADGLDTVSIVVQESHQLYETMHIEDCHSSNPDDCYVQTLVEIPQKSEDYIVVLDTIGNTEYEWFHPVMTRVVNIPPYKDWEEMLCESQLTERIITDVSRFLQKEGLYNGVIDGKRENRILWKAFGSFQQRNGLPYGSLNMKTLDFMGIEY